MCWLWIFLINLRMFLYIVLLVKLNQICENPLGVAWKCIFTKLKITLQIYEWHRLNYPTAHNVVKGAQCSTSTAGKGNIHINAAVLQSQSQNITYDSKTLWGTTSLHSKNLYFLYINYIILMLPYFYFTHWKQSFPLVAFCHCVVLKLLPRWMIWILLPPLAPVFPSTTVNMIMCLVYLNRKSTLMWESVFLIHLFIAPLAIWFPRY